MDLKLLTMVLVSHLISAGLLFGPLGLLAVAGLPDRHQIVYLRYLAEAQGYQLLHNCGGQAGGGGET